MKRKKSIRKKHIFILSSLLLLMLLILFVGANYSGMFIESSESTQDFRPSYCKFVDGERKCVDPKIFQYLPPYPKDFMQIYHLVYYGKINNLSAISEEYWKQPEILPTWKTSGIDAYLNPEPGRFGAFGFGCYPSEAFVSLKPGEAARITTWLHTSWAVQTLQGMSLKIIYPSHAESSRGIAIEQDPSVVKNYFEASVTPNVVLLGPTWPYFEHGSKFEHDGWIVPITIEIRTRKEIPKGNYVVGVMPSLPPEDKNEEWTLKYKLRYTPIQFFQIGKPYFTMFITVE